MRKKNKNQDNPNKTLTKQNTKQQPKSQKQLYKTRNKKKGNRVIFRMSTNHHTQGEHGRPRRWLAGMGEMVMQKTKRLWRSFVWGGMVAQRRLAWCLVERLAR